METVKISIEDMKKLGVSWADYCKATGANEYAVREGLDEKTIVYCPVSLIIDNLKWYNI